jgi:hypothetical protein
MAFLLGRILNAGLYPARFISGGQAERRRDQAIE